MSYHVSKVKVSYCFLTVGIVCYHGNIQFCRLYSALLTKGNFQIMMVLITQIFCLGEIAGSLGDE
jgi:hypothetical protein